MSRSWASVSEPHTCDVIFCCKLISDILGRIPRSLIIAFVNSHTVFGFLIIAFVTGSKLNLINSAIYAYTYTHTHTHAHTHTHTPCAQLSREQEECMCMSAHMIMRMCEGMCMCANV